MARAAHLGFLDAGQRGQARIGEAHALQAILHVTVERRQAVAPTAADSSRTISSI
jgi:hypothetical protein